MVTRYIYNVTIHLSERASPLLSLPTTTENIIEEDFLSPEWLILADEVWDHNVWSLIFNKTAQFLNRTLNVLQCLNFQVGYYYLLFIYYDLFIIIYLLLFIYYYLFIIIYLLLFILIIYSDYS